MFARILDLDRGGHFTIAPPVRHARTFAYLDGTNVLRTRFRTSDADVHLTTFMPHIEGSVDASSGPRRIVRLLACDRGEIDVTIELVPGFDYGRRPAEARTTRNGVELWPVTGGRDGLALASTVPLEAGPGRVETTFRARPGERHAFVLDWRTLDEPAPAVDARALAPRLLDEEISFWNRWLSRCAYHGPYRAEVERSALALKLMQHAPTGAFVAAPTTSLPESLGGFRNWDYRFAWLRDGVFIVMAFETLGYKDEARRFKEWLAAILRRDAPDDIQMLYQVDGARELEEIRLDHLEGYRRSSPVRVGNAAAEQHQLDTYGEVMMCFHRAKHVFEGEHRDENWRAIRSLVEWVREHWERGDSGLWEMRGRHRHYVYSKMMAWFALDHGLKIAAENDLDAPFAAWDRAMDAVRDRLMTSGWSEDFGSFVQSEERADADASNLLLPILGFIDYGDPRMRATVSRIVEDLGQHGLLQRYVVDDGLDGSEGAFLVGSFWLAENLAAVGDVAGARAAIDAALDTAGPLGLLAEEADPVSREPLGNYPQALSHLGLILAAVAVRDAPRVGVPASRRSV